MNKSVLIAVFSALFLFMIADLIFTFNALVKAVGYGGMFIAGIVIYLLQNGFTYPNSKENDDNLI